MNDKPVEPSGPPNPPTKQSPATLSAANFSVNEDVVPPPTLMTDRNAAPPDRIGDYTILGKLGEGGMGTVYLAVDSRLRRNVAIKVMKPELAARPANCERFLREAQAAAAIEHDNIVPIWQIGQATDGSPFIAMPFLQGETLEDRLKREPIQPLGVILKVAREVAEGLAAAHAKELIHRDIKPANVWIEGIPEAEEINRQVQRCKILDFGLARSSRTEDVQITASGAVVGTPAYMAPEQAAGGRVDHRADLFSLGVMLYRMSTGKSPFEGPNMMAVLSALANVTPSSARRLNKTLPPALSDLIGQLMSKDPAQRTPSAAEVAAAVQSIEAVLASGPRRSRTPLLLAIALLALVALGWKLVTVGLPVETAKGTFAVEIGDPETAALYAKSKLMLTGPDGEIRHTLLPGERDKEIEAGPYTIRLEGVKGLTLNTPEFTLEKGGKVTVRVTRAPKALVPKALDPDRKAAVWVLSIDGTIGVNGQNWGTIKTAADLPREAFRLTHVFLRQNKKVSDAGVAHFEGCKDLIVLHLNGTDVGNAGMAHFEGCKNLTDLDLCLTRVSDAGLIHFAGCKDLIRLSLSGPQVSDAGLAHFEGCKYMTDLFLAYTRVSGEVLAYFKDSKSLSDLVLYNTQVTDADLAHVTEWKRLTRLLLQQSNVSVAKIAELKKAMPKCKFE